MSEPSVPTPERPGAEPPAPERAPVDNPPTDAPCGSAEKVRVMRRRARAGLPLFHPGDSTERVAPKQESNNATARSLPLGVSWDRKKRRFRARVTLRGERHYLGLFATAVLAARAIEDARAAAGTYRPGARNEAE